MCSPAVLFSATGALLERKAGGVLDGKSAQDCTACILGPLGSPSSRTCSEAPSIPGVSPAEPGLGQEEGEDFPLPSCWEAGGQGATSGQKLDMIYLWLGVLLPVPMAWP